jgi:hypothetical protein
MSMPNLKTFNLIYSHPAKLPIDPLKILKFHRANNWEFAQVSEMCARRIPYEFAKLFELWNDNQKKNFVCVSHLQNCTLILMLKKFKALPDDDRCCQLDD